MSRKLQILVLDDDAELEELLKVKLRPKAFNVTFCTRIKDFTIKFFNEQWDFCLIDLNLEEAPEAGFHVLNMVRAKEKKYTPIIMISNEGEKEKIAHAIECGADDYVSKPINFDILHTKIGQLSDYESSDLNCIQSQLIPSEFRTVNLAAEFQPISLSEDEFFLTSASYISKGSLVTLEGEVIEEIFLQDSITLEVIRTETDRGLYKIGLGLDNESSYISNVRTYLREKLDVK